MPRKSEQRRRTLQKIVRFSPGEAADLDLIPAGQFQPLVRALLAEYAAKMRENQAVLIPKETPNAA